MLVDADDPDLLGDEMDEFGYNASRSQVGVDKYGGYAEDGQGYPPSLNKFGSPATSRSSLPYPGDPGMRAPRPPFASQPGGSMDSGLPLAQSAAMPAGYGQEGPFADSYAAGGFKSIEADDEPSIPLEDETAKRGATLRPGQAGRSRAIPRDSPFDGFKRSVATMTTDVKALINRKGKGKELEGERIIRLNDPITNDKEGKFCDNYISTSKYNVITFLPKFLAGELLKANVSRVLGVWISWAS